MATPVDVVGTQGGSRSIGKPGPGNTLTESRILARFALALSYEDIPQDVVALARGHFLDVLGTALAATRFEFAPAILAGARELGQGTQARALGSGTSLPAASAALVNGTLAHGLDFDDTHIAAIYHASAPAFAAALAAGEAADASGKDVLTAYVVALELGCRLASSAKGAFHDRGLHPTSLCGIFAAAACGAKLAGVQEEALVLALGLCGSQAGGILEIRDSWLKRFHPGWAAHAGLAAVALARHGFKGPDTVFEGKHGFYASHIGRVPAGEDAPTHRLGQHWQALGLALKPYPCCHFIHAFVDAALALRGAVPVDEIERVDCPLSERLHHMVAQPRERRIRPATTYDALFSVPYVTALALVKGRVDLAAFYDESLLDPAVLDLAARTHCCEDPESDYPTHYPGEVRITLKDGRVITRREPVSRGTPERRLTREEINGKFLANAARAVGAAQARRIIDAVWRLEKLESIKELVSMCVVKNQAAQ